MEKGKKWHIWTYWRCVWMMSKREHVQHVSFLLLSADSKYRIKTYQNHFHRIKSPWNPWLSSMPWAEILTYFQSKPLFNQLLHNKRIQHFFFVLNMADYRNLNLSTTVLLLPEAANWSSLIGIKGFILYNWF